MVQLTSLFGQWEFQDPKMEVPTIYKAYFLGLNFRGYTPNIWSYMVQLRTSILGSWRSPIDLGLFGNKISPNQLDE